MKLSAITAFSIVSLGSMVQATCFGGGNVRPDHGVEFIEFAMAAGNEMSGTIANGQKKTKFGRTSDNVCLNLSLENKSGAYKETSVEQIMDAWIREWVACEHGGERTYPDELAYA
jgi:hypothetical protein